MTNEEEEKQEEASRPEVTRLRDVLDAIVAYEIEDDLIRENDLGVGNSFSGSQSLFQDAIDYAERLRGLAWTDIPTALVDQAGDRGNQLLEGLEAVKTFDVEEGNVTARRDQTAQQVNDRLDSFRTITIPVVGYLSWQKIDLPNLQRDMASVLDEVQSQAATITAELEEQKTNAETMVKDIQEASAEIGVSVHAEAFKNAAESHEKGAVVMLGLSVAAAVVTVVGVFLLVVAWENNGDISDASVLQVVLAKGTYLAVTAFVTLSFFRMWRSRVHMAETNRHRQRALQTFQTFTNAAGDEDTKRQILLEATHAIFGHTATGLIDGGESSVIELLDAAGGTSMLRKGS